MQTWPHIWGQVKRSWHLSKSMMGMLRLPIKPIILIYINKCYCMPYIIMSGVSVSCGRADALSFMPVCVHTYAGRLSVTPQRWDWSPSGCAQMQFRWAPQIQHEIKFTTWTTTHMSAPSFLMPVLITHGPGCLCVYASVCVCVWICALNAPNFSNLHYVSISAAMIPFALAVSTMLASWFSSMTSLIINGYVFVYVCARTLVLY